MKSKTWVKGFALGCGGVLLIPIGIVTLVGVRTLVPLRTASRNLDLLESRFGSAESFRPALGGAIPGDRVDAFIDVRLSLEDSCNRFAAMQKRMQRVETLDERDPTAEEIAATTGELAGVAFEITPFIGKFFKQRNHALVEAGMGLGEYTYIYAAAYHEALQDESLNRMLFSEEGPFSSEVQATLSAILSDRLDVLTSVSVERSLNPFRSRLDDLFCASTVGLDLDRDSRRALIIALE